MTFPCRHRPASLSSRFLLSLFHFDRSDPPIPRPNPIQMAEMKKEPHTRAIVAYKYICAFRHDFHLPPSSEICPQLGEMKLPDDGYSDGRIAGRVDRNPGRGFFFLLEDGRAWTFDSCRWWMSRLGYVICLLWLRFFRPCICMALVGFSGARA